MHELSIANAIVKTVIDALPTDTVETARITTVRVAIGALSGVVPQALEFAYDVAADGTPLADAALEIERTPVIVDCPACGHQELPGTSDFHCPSCRQLCGDVISGKELQVVNVTFDEAAVSAP